MTRIALTILAVIVTLGCSPESPGAVDIDSSCRFDQTARAESHRCLAECAKAGNPMSKMKEDDPRQLVQQCASECAEIYCDRRYTFWDNGNQWDCRSGLRQPYFDACVQAGWKP